jgi:hypothetical protein
MGNGRTADELNEPALCRHVETVVDGERTPGRRASSRERVADIKPILYDLAIMADKG